MSESFSVSVMSDGFCVGSVKTITHISEDNLNKAFLGIDAEVNRLQVAFTKLKSRLQGLSEKTKQEAGAEAAEIFETHVMICEDPEFYDESLKAIAEKKINAELAVVKIADHLIETMKSMDNDYMNQRANDFNDLKKQLLQFLTNPDETDTKNHSQEKFILAGYDITPSELMSVDKNLLLGLISQVGGSTSHTAILAKNLQIPAVFEFSNFQALNKKFVAIDTDKKRILLEPTDIEIQEIKTKSEKAEKENQRLEKFLNLDSKTLDGFLVNLESNIASVEDLYLTEKFNSKGIGLFRTEFLYMKSTSAPNESEQFKNYKTILEHQKPHSVVIRTLDAGGDKHIDYLKIPKEDNPFLGFRAIRYCLQNLDIFKTQIKALLKASAFGNLRIMFPMISCVEEVIAAKKITFEVASKLTNKIINDDKTFKENFSVELGIMIETPAAVILSSQLAKHVDFFSIGTNDLSQYTCAADRTNKSVQYLTSVYHPAVLNSIIQTVENSRKVKKDFSIGICGNLAAESSLTALWVGLGINHLSINPTAILKVKEKLLNLSQAKCVGLVEQIKASETNTDVEKILN